MKKRILSALLVLCLACGLVSTAWAADGRNVSEPSGSVAVQEVDGDGVEAQLPAADAEKSTADTAAEEKDADSSTDDSDSDSDPAADDSQGGNDVGADSGNVTVPQPLRVAPNNASTLADDGTRVIDLGETIQITGMNVNPDWEDQDEWRISSSDGGSVIVSPASGSKTVTVQGESEGTVEITHRYAISRKYGSIIPIPIGYNYAEETISITVTGKVLVYVYVASKVTDELGNTITDEKGDYLSWGSNEEFLSLLKIDGNTIDRNDYFPVGQIELDSSFFDRNVETYLNNSSDWDVVKNALRNLNKSTLIDDTANGGKDYTKNQNNEITDYIDQIIMDFEKVGGSQCSGLFEWDQQTSPGFATNAKYHLDLRFNASTISFYTGNNKITDGNAADGKLVDSRVYITGSEVQKPRNLHIPAGYKFDGYFSDADFTQEWDGIGKPLEKDTNVYIRISPMDNVSIYYNVVGEGTVSRTFETFNPAGSAAGAIATADPGYRFVGWYYDEQCTKLASEKAAFVPDESENGVWTEGATYNYYAKFVPDTADVTITKTFEGLPTKELEAEAAGDITFTVQPQNGNKIEGITLTDTDGDGTYTATIEDLTIGDTYTIEENVTAPENYKNTGKTIEFNDEVIADGRFTVIDGSNELAITNEYERKTGTLVLNKDIDGWAMTAEQQEAVNALTFQFTVEGPADAADKLAAGTVGSEDAVYFESKGDKATVTVQVQVGQDLTINNLPTGTYTVTEDTPVSEILAESFYFVESNQPEQGVVVNVTENTQAKATITNTYKPYKTLTITKSVTGEMGNLNQWFDFTLTAPVNIQYSTSEDQEPITEGSSFSLKNGSTVTLTKIKEGDSIAITETELTSLGYSFKGVTVDSSVLKKANADESGYTETTNGIQIKVPVSSNNDYSVDLGTVTFTNQRLSVTPTGLEDDHSAPYTILVTVAGIAGLALIGGIVARRRRRME